jgi:hypothetical protein
MTKITKLILSTSLSIYAPPPPLLLIKESLSFVSLGLIDSYRRTLELTEIEGSLQALQNAQLIGSAHHTLVADGALNNILIDLLQNTDNMTSVIQNRGI